MDRGSTRDRPLSAATAQVLKVFLVPQGEQRYGYEVIKATGMAGGVVYPILAALSRRGWLVNEWEQGDPSKLGRPQRRIYTLTPEGRDDGAAALTALAKLFAPNPTED